MITLNIVINLQSEVCGFNICLAPLLFLLHQLEDCARPVPVNASKHFAF